MAYNVIDYNTILIRLAIATAFGILIGYEREHMKKPAGVRTMALVSMGATLFTLLSFEYLDTVSASRVVANIVLGIGFLGAGTIFRDHEHVRGVTTAATVWVMAGVGTAVGLGLYFISLVATIIIFVILNLDKLNLKKKRI